MSRFLSLILALWLPAVGAAFAPDLDSVAGVPRLELPAAEIANAVAASKDQPRRFAVSHALYADTRNGIWDEPEPGIARWRLRARSDAATSVSFRLERLQLPADAQLWVYGADGRDVQGPYGDAVGDTLWTPLVRSAEAVLEARMPVAQRGDFAVDVVEAFHGFRDPATAARDKSFPDSNGSSGSCNIDVVCPAADNWRDEVRSVTLLTVGNAIACTGTLVNNTAQNDRPLILTANHCEISAANVSATIAYFNVERSGCGSGSFGSVTRNIHGKTLLAWNKSADYAIFELQSTPPASYDVHYAGWDIGTTPPASGASIHHPSADDKKISLFTQTATAVNSVNFGTFTAAKTWAVIWNQGTTEPGSSGGGLWNQNHRLVGTLSGGSSSCSSTGDEDFFARLDYAWTASSTTGQTLKVVLDPGNTGSQTLDGKDPGAIVVLANDSFTVAEDSTTSLDVLANDSAGLSLLDVGAPSQGGTATIDTQNQRIVYVPATHFSGTETFTYSAQNASGDSAIATVTVTVTPVNDPPEAVPDSFTAVAGTSSDLPVLSNDTTPESGETLTLVSVQGFSAGGSGVISGDVVRYTPANGFTGIETFTYTIRDPAGLTDTATVTVTVSASSGGGGGGGGAIDPLLLLVIAAALGAQRKPRTRPVGANASVAFTARNTPDHRLRL